MLYISWGLDALLALLCYISWGLDALIGTTCMSKLLLLHCQVGVVVVA